MSNYYPAGVSVIICCYNSAQRLPATLNALAAQHCQPSLQWEVIIVDNGSVDNSGSLAREIWKTLNNTSPIKIVIEPAQGLSNARRRGVSEAQYTYLLFCDDDNWLGENYVQGVFDIFQSDDRIAATGGMGIPVFESSEPFWFYEYAEAFALGSQEILREDGRQLNLYGAGMGVRLSVLNDLYSAGFTPLFSGRKGTSLSSSEDTELTSIFVLQGYNLAYSDELKFYHFMTKERLTFDYLKRLYIAFGNDGPVRNLYYSYVSRRIFHRQIKNWWFHLGVSFYRLIKYFFIPPKRFGRHIYFLWNWAYIRRLLMLKNTYKLIKIQINTYSDTGYTKPQQQSQPEHLLSSIK